MVYKQVLANVVDLKLSNFENINLLMKVLEETLIRELIISLSSQNRDKLLIAIE